MKRLALLVVAALLTAACGDSDGDDELSARECRDRVGQIARDVGLDKAERELDDLVDQGCERTTIDDEAAKSRDSGGTGGAGAEADLYNRGKEAFTAYINGLIGGDYQAAVDRGAGSAKAIAGYFNTLSRIPNLPEDFKVPKRQVSLTWPEGGTATRAADGTVTLDSQVSAAIRGGGADEDTTYSAIKLQEADGKLAVDDFVRGKDGPVSEDVYRTDTSTGEGNGVSVKMGPGFGMRGAIGEGGVNFANFVFAYTNNTPYEITLKPTTNNKMNFAASFTTDVDRYLSSSSAGTTVASGETGFGFLFFNAKVAGQGGVLLMEFVDEDDDEFEVKVSISSM